MKNISKEYYVFLILAAIIISTPFVTRKLVFSDSDKESKILDAQDSLLIVRSLTKDINTLNRKLSAKIPKSYYLVINSTANQFSLYKGEALIKRDMCSTGSYMLLKNGDEQQWMFKTPKGEFRIQYKTTSPVWKKPDWAFIEEGLPVPSADHNSRYEYGVLGDYALSLGQGYLIHGTLYQRFLGLPVTHGCIRLNDANLELVYNSLSTGSRVYIY
jgi:L,D-transpeptidase YbiS